MAQIVTKYAARKFLSKQMNKADKKGKRPADAYDPYFVEIDDPRKPGKKKKVKKQIPDYIPEKDAIILAKMRQRAYWLDCGLFSLFGIQFGYSSLIGLIPAAGDFIDAALAILLWLRCRRISCGLGAGTEVQMIINIIIDLVVGLVPVVGDLMDAHFRANSRNVRLLEKRLDAVYKPGALKKNEKEKRKSMGLKPDELTIDLPPPATVYEDSDFSDDDRLPRHRQDTEPRRPEPARVPTETRGGERPERQKKGFFSKGNSKRDTRPDVEMGQARHSRR